MAPERILDRAKVLLYLRAVGSGTRTHSRPGKGPTVFEGSICHSPDHGAIICCIRRQQNPEHGKQFLRTRLQKKGGGGGEGGSPPLFAVATSICLPSYTTYRMLCETEREGKGPTVFEGRGEGPWSAFLTGQKSYCI